jgi:transposase
LSFLEKETDFSIRYRLAFLNKLRVLSFDLDKVCQVFSVAKSTAYVWIRKWNEYGYEGIAHPFHKSDQLGRRPPKLNEEDLEKLKILLSKKSN